MASGGAAGFLEEWKAKREKMRAKSLSESGVGTGGAPGQPARNGTDGGAETSVTAGDRGSTNRGATGRPGERKAEDESRGQAPICGSSRDVEPRVCTTGASTSPQTSSPSPGSREPELNCVDFDVVLSSCFFCFCFFFQKFCLFCLFDIILFSPHFKNKIKKKLQKLSLGNDLILLSFCI